MPPMSMTKLDEKKYVAQKQKKTEELKEQYAKQIAAHHKAKRDKVRHAHIKDKAFQKDGQRFSTNRYRADPNPEGGRSFVLTNEDSKEQLKKRYMPYDLSWVK